MIKDNVNLERIEVVNDFDAQQDGFYLDPDIAKKIHKRIDVFLKGLFEKLALTALEESTKKLVKDLIRNKIFNEVLYLIEPKLKDNIALDILKPRGSNKDSGAKHTLKKPIVAVGSFEIYKDYFPPIVVDDPELYAAIEVAMFVPTLLLNIINRNNSEIYSMIMQLGNEMRNSQIISKEPKDRPIEKIKTDKQRFIEKLHSALNDFSKHNKKSYKKDVAAFMKIPRSTFNDALDDYTIVRDNKTGLYIDLEKKQPI
jgi:hypothetical protein